MAVAVLLASGAAFLSALAVVFQRVALESAPTSNSLSPRLLTHALRKRGWLVGFVLMLGTFGLQATALRFGQLNVVQPVLTTELIFLVAILVVGFRRSVGWREVAGIVAIVVGLAAFFGSASPAVGKGQPDRAAWIAVAAVTVASALALVMAGRVGPRWWRATALGSAAAILFADNAAFTKTATTLIRDGGLAGLFGNADPYLIGLSGAVGLFFLQGALHAGPITASRTANVVVNPLVSIVIGATAFGERLRAGTWSVTVDVLAIAVLCAGIAVLGRSPLVTGVGGEASGEYLGARAVAAAAPVPVASDEPR
ncbi:MAG TPA: DMT family transporter [Streptosporangiaceae bacterium]|nr:DMT family transporter [Streptosporangiaceae bacterium]